MLSTCTLELSNVSSFHSERHLCASVCAFAMRIERALCMYASSYPVKCAFISVLFCYFLLLLLLLFICAYTYVLAPVTLLSLCDCNCLHLHVFFSAEECQIQSRHGPYCVRAVPKSIEENCHNKVKVSVNENRSCTFSLLITFMI